MENEIAALCTRVLIDTPTPEPLAWRQVRAEVLLALGNFPRVETMSYSAWRRRYCGAAGLALDRAKELLYCGAVSLKDFAKTSAFVKVEEALWFLGFSELRPRLIIQCPPITKVALGPWMVAACKALAEFFGFQTDPADAPEFFEIGKTAEQVGQWYAYWRGVFTDSCAYKSDYSAYDGTQSAFSHRTEGTAYRLMGLNKRRLKIFLTQACDVSGVTKNGVFFHRSAFRRSGVPNTTLGNTLINLFVLRTALRSQGAIPGVDYAIMAHGDDGAGFMKPQFVEGVRHFIHRCGLKVKLDYGVPLERMRYCSNIFYPTAEGLVPGPTYKSLLRTNTTISAVPEAAFSQHRRGVALGLRNAVAHIPLWNDWVETTLEQTEGSRGQWLEKAQREMAVKVRECSSHAETAETTAFVARAYGVDLALIRAMRTRIRSMTRIGVYSSPVVLSFIDAVARTEGLE